MHTVLAHSWRLVVAVGQLALWLFIAMICYGGALGAAVAGVPDGLLGWVVILLPWGPVVAGTWFVPEARHKPVAVVVTVLTGVGVLIAVALDVAMVVATFSQ